MLFQYSDIYSYKAMEIINKHIFLELLVKSVHIQDDLKLSCNDFVHTIVYSLMS